MDVRTDLAIELHADALKGSSSDCLDGIRVSEEKDGVCTLTRISVENEKGEALIARPTGNYVTLEFGRVGVADTEKFTALCSKLQGELSKMIKDKCHNKPVKKVLVAGLGNADITADALGPLTVKNIIVTGHLKAISEKVFRSFGGVEIMALSMGVMAQTGMESAQILKSVCDRIKPQLVVAVDSLASNMMSRLVKTVQISDTGINPGSGIGNRRDAIDEKLLGVPVISVGVPTMVEIATLAADVINSLDLPTVSPRSIRELLGDSAKVLVTPKDSGIIVSDIAKMIGFALNMCFIEDISYDEIARLIS